MSELRELLTVDDVARITGLSPYTVRAAIRDLELPASKLRGRWRVSPDDLAGWIDAGRAQPTAVVVPAATLVAPHPPPATPDGGYRQAARARTRKAA